MKKCWMGHQLLTGSGWLQVLECPPSGTGGSDFSFQGALSSEKKMKDTDIFFIVLT